MKKRNGRHRSRTGLCVLFSVTLLAAGALMILVLYRHLIQSEPATSEDDRSVIPIALETPESAPTVASVSLPAPELTSTSEQTPLPTSEPSDISSDTGTDVAEVSEYSPEVQAILAGMTLREKV